MQIQDPGHEEPPIELRRPSWEEAEGSTEGPPPPLPVHALHIPTEARSPSPGSWQPGHWFEMVRVACDSLRLHPNGCRPHPDSRWPIQCRT